MDFGTRFNHGQFTLFLGLELDFKTSISATEFEHLAREAWIALRFQVPMIAARTPVNADNRAIFTYRSPDSFAEVEDWATRTVRVGRDCDSVDTLRHEVGNQYTPDPDGDQVFLYVASNNGRPSGLLLQSSHMIFDGMGSKALMHIYLRHMLTPLLSGESKADIATLTWGNEVETLLPCVSEVLAHNEPRVGSEYDKTLQEVLKGFASYMPKMYPFKVRAAPGPGPRVHMQRFFTTQESAQIRAAVRTHGFTVSQLFHAALNLVVAIDNPPTNETAADAAFVYYGIVNSRPDRLRAPYSGREGYPGNCLGLSALSFPLDTLRGRVDFFDRSLLLAMTEQVKEAYEVQKQYPALLAVQSHVFDIMLSPFFAGAPLPPPLGGPYFIGDGITENYIDHEYKDNSGKSSVSVRSVFISANLTDPAWAVLFYFHGMNLMSDASSGQSVPSLQLARQTAGRRRLQ